MLSTLQALCGHLLFTYFIDWLCLVQRCGFLWLLWHFIQVYCLGGRSGFLWLLWHFMEVYLRIVGTSMVFEAEVAKHCEPGIREVCSGTHLHGFSLSRDYLHGLLQNCIKDSVAINRVHSLIIYSGLDRVPVFSDHLIRLYASLECLEEANFVFSTVSRPSEYTWNAIISAHATTGEYAKARELFTRMLDGGILPNKCLFLSILKLCSHEDPLCWGQLVHDQVIRASLESDTAIGSTLVSMYARHGNVTEAQNIFDGFPDRDTVLWGAMLSGYCSNGQCHVAFKYLEQMQKEGINPDNMNFLGMLKSSTTLEQGRIIHNMIVRYGLELDVIVGNSLIEMYATCEGLKEAYIVFDMLNNRDIVSWNALIVGYARLGLPANDLCERMREEGFQGDKITFLLVLKACTIVGAIEHGMRVHSQLMEIGLDSDVAIFSALIGMYNKGGRLQDADMLFDSMPDKDSVAWSAMIAGHADNGDESLALELFKAMQSQGLTPIKVTFLSALKACLNEGLVEEGRLVHDQILKCGFECDDVVGTAVVDMYCRHSELDDANKVFDNLGEQDVVAWGTMLGAYARCGKALVALEVFQKMLAKGVHRDKLIYVCMLKTCGTAQLIVQGQLIMHDLLVNTNLVDDVDVRNALIELYAKCACVEDACKIVEGSLVKDLISWNTLLSGCVESGLGWLACDLFTTMQELGFTPDTAMIACVLKGCGSVQSLWQGRLVHDYVVCMGHHSDPMVGNSLLGMYFACGDVREAERVFDQLGNQDGASWGSMILGYAQNGHGLYALKLFEKVLEQGVTPDDFIFTCTLKACSTSGCSKPGRLVHDLIIRNSVKSNMPVGNALMDMYAKCGWPCEAQKVFNNMPTRDEVSWGTMISCASLHNDSSEVLQLYMRMWRYGIKPDKVTASCALKACSNIGAIKYGKIVHDQSIRCGLETDVVVGTTLIDMYTRCGMRVEAGRVFDKMHHRNEASWTALLSASVQNSSTQHVRGCVDGMSLGGLSPDSQMYTSILAACSHAGQLEEVGHHVKFMKERYGVVPGVEHFNCMVDTLGRVGRLQEAQQVLLSMPTMPDIAGWVSLLTACRTFGDSLVGSQCLDHVSKLDLSGTGAYALFASMYGDGYNWLNIQRLEDIRKSVSAWKKPAQAWLELPGAVHLFNIGGDSFSSRSDLYSFKVVRVRMRKQGFIPQLDIVMETDSCGEKGNDESGVFSLDSWSQEIPLHASLRLNRVLD